MAVPAGLAIATAIGVTSTVGVFAVQAATFVAFTAATSLALSALSPKQKLSTVGDRLSNSRVTGAREGQSVPDVYNKFRMGGSLIWAAQFNETVSTSTQSGGKGLGGSSQTSTNYDYSCSFAVAFCEGVVDSLDTLYFDGNEVDLSEYDYTFYAGDMSQTPDPTIESVEGLGTVPGYRGISYIVFTDLPLEAYGNRIPQVTVELTRSIPGGNNLGSLITQIAKRGGFPEDKLDTTDIDDISIEGFLGQGYGAPRQDIELLMSIFAVEAYLSGDTLYFRKKSTVNEVSVSVEDIIITSDDPTGFEIERRQLEDLSSQVVVNYVDAERAYNEASVPSDVIYTGSNKTETVGVPLVLDTDFAQTQANLLLQEDHATREGVKFSLPLAYKSIKLGDTMVMSIRGVPYYLKVTQREISDRITIAAVSVNNDVYGFVSTFVGTNSLKPVSTTQGPLTADLVELPLLPSAPDVINPRFASVATPWLRGVAIYEDDNSGGYRSNTTQTFATVMGGTTTSFPKGLTGVIDENGSIDVSLLNTRENLVSISNTALLNGGNVAAVMTPSGQFEVFQYRDVLLNGDGTYTLSGLIRGQLGTEYYMGDPTPSGSRFISLGADRLGVINTTVSDINLPIELIYGHSRLPFDHPSYASVTMTPKFIALRPYSPVQLKAQYDGTDLELSWVRRDRSPVDSFDFAEVPLSEDVERYRLRIYSDNLNTVVRTRVVTSPDFTYTQAMQIEDFGMAKVNVNYDVAQINSIYGEGTPGEYRI